MTTLVLENPSVETLKDGTKKYIDSFGNMLKLKAIYGDKFEIEPLDSRGFNTLPSMWNKTRDDTGEPAVIPGHETYACWPFHKYEFVNDNGKLNYYGDDIFYCIIPEGFNNKIKPGKFIKGRYEKCIPCLAEHIKNLDTGDTYDLQSMGGCGDPEYNFLCGLIDMFEETLDSFQEIALLENPSPFEEMLPLCVKRIGYLKP